MPKSAMLAIVVPVLLLVGSVFLLVGRDAGYASTPTTSATPSASVTPYPLESTIEIRFVFNGEPVEVFLVEPIRSIQSDGQVCAVPIPGTASFYPGYTTKWPPPALAVREPECVGGPPRSIQFEFQSPAAIFSTTLIWSGSDVRADLEIPPQLAPTATPSSSPSPTPSQYPQSVITIRFVRNAQPVRVRLSQAISLLTADGVNCFPGVLPAEVTAEGYSINWPLAPDPERAPRCSDGPPATLRFEFLSEFGQLVAHFFWTGGPMGFDLEVPAIAGVSPSPTATAGTLPATGGSPTSGPSEYQSLWQGIVPLLVLLVMVGVWAAVSRARDPRAFD